MTWNKTLPLNELIDLLFGQFDEAFDLLESPYFDVEDRRIIVSLYGFES